MSKVNMQHICGFSGSLKPNNVKIRQCFGETMQICFSVALKAYQVKKKAAYKKQCLSKNVYNDNCRQLSVRPFSVVSSFLMTVKQVFSQCCHII